MGAVQYEIGHRMHAGLREDLLFQSPQHMQTFRLRMGVAVAYYLSVKQAFTRPILNRQALGHHEPRGTTNTPGLHPSVAYPCIRKLAIPPPTFDCWHFWQQC